MTFSPQRIPISNITQAIPAVVTTSTNHNLTTGQVVRIHVPKNYGMYEINNQIFIITVISNVTFSLQYSQVPPEINVDTRAYGAFTTPSKPQFTAEVIPIGSGPTPKLSPEVYLRNNTCESTIQDSLVNNSTNEIPF